MTKHIFFDLDHTLWDFERNSEVCLQAIHATQLSGLVPYEDFSSTFRVINRGLWRQLESNTITHEELRRTRFKNTLISLQLPCSDAVSLQMNEHFMELLPVQRHLVEGAEEVLEYLFPRYPLHIISNGYLDIQTKKMAGSGILHYFQKLVTSDVAGARKPDREIFAFALRAAGITAQNAIYIGDDEIADQRGAINAGIPYIHFDPNAPSSAVAVQHLSELKTRL